MDSIHCYKSTPILTYFKKFIRKMNVFQRNSNKFTLFIHNIVKQGQKDEFINHNYFLTI